MIHTQFVALWRCIAEILACWVLWLLDELLVGDLLHKSLCFSQTLFFFSLHFSSHFSSIFFNFFWVLATIATIVRVNCDNSAIVAKHPLTSLTILRVDLSAENSRFKPSQHLCSPPKSTGKAYIPLAESQRFENGRGMWNPMHGKDQRPHWGGLLLHHSALNLSPHMVPCYCLANSL